jgi:NAD dependent epimerase/dehydratase family enzyme
MEQSQQASQAWHSAQASRRKETEELRIAHVLSKAGIPVEQNTYICCWGFGGTFPTFRYMHLMIAIDDYIMHLEVVEHDDEVLSPAQLHIRQLHGWMGCL